MNENLHPNVTNPFIARPWIIGNSTANAVDKGRGLKGVVAGGITGGVEICITYPTDFIKTQLQLDEKGGKKHFDGIFDCLKKTVQEKGFFGLYRGLSILLYGSIPKSAVRFGVFEALKVRLSDAQGHLKTAPRLLLCGLGAGVGEAVFVVTPMETIKVKFINDQRMPDPQYKGFLHGVSTIIQQDGSIRGIYKGVVPTVLKQGSNQAIRFFVVESFKNLYKAGDDRKHVPNLLVGVFGAVGGACSVFCNTPLDVVKTRMQSLDAHKYKGMVDCVVKIWKKEGPTAFYKGTLPRLSRVCCDGAITFMVYDIIMDLFNKIW